MDWDRVKIPVQPRPDPPAPMLIEECWRLWNRTRDRVLVCTITQDAGSGYEARCGYDERELLMSIRRPSIEQTRLEADAMRATCLASGFTEDDGTHR